MCGIFGTIGPGAVQLTLDGIRRLQYRGYDSAGLGTIVAGKPVIVKTVGKIDVLERELANRNLESSLALAHTRWATHGKPSELNAHPHFDEKNHLALVHNGIIENHEELRNFLKNLGIQTVSDTDSEVIAQLIGYFYQGNLLQSVKQAFSLLHGAFATLLIHIGHPFEMIAVAKDMPLAIGKNNEHVFIASDPQSFSGFTKEAIYLQNGEVALVKLSGIEIFDSQLKPLVKKTFPLSEELMSCSKEGYAHYMLKEIWEQPIAIQNALAGRINFDALDARLEDLLPDEKLNAYKRIMIVACGTSYHAGLVASYMIENLARIPVEVHISSEFRYRNPILDQESLVIVISQSGETADTLAALRELKQQGLLIIGICNAYNSTIAREVDHVLYLKAGPEIGVASTKAFTSQLTVLALFALRLARLKKLSDLEAQQFIEALQRLPQQVQSILESKEKIEQLAIKYGSVEDFFFLGRRFMYPTALEAALKLKEIAYVNANGYPAGEMKHGPIALIHPETLSIAFLADRVTFEKSLSNLSEIHARGGKILAVTDRENNELKKIADDIYYLPATHDAFAPVLSAIFGQYFAYLIAEFRGTEIDQPRNLAKSVTVE